MKTKIKYTTIQTSRGWEVWDGFAFEPDSEIFPTRKTAQAVADEWNYAVLGWSREPAADAPHCDNF